jgi:GNAT superfamily N-acetyltransferase
VGEVVLREAVLRDGTRATISPARHEDRELLRVSYESLSPESQFHRFLTAVPHLTDRMLDQLVGDVDWIDHVALVLAVESEAGAPRKVAIARLIRYDDRPSDADVAVTVLDAWQGLGVATLLLEELMRLRPGGVTRLVTEVAGDNPAAVAMLARLGGTTVTPTSRDSLEVVVDLAGADPEGGDGAVAPS